MIEREGPFWVVWHGHYKWAYAGTLCRAYEYSQLIGSRHG